MSETATAAVPGFWRSALSGPDNQSIDINRLLGLLGMGAYIAISVSAYIVRAQNFDPMSWAGGLGAVVLGVGFGVRVKQDAEPKP